MQIIAPKWIIPVEPVNTVLKNHVIIIAQDKIIEILPEIESLKKYKSIEKIILDNHLIMPGLINMHAHSPMTLFRGLADDLLLMDWLNNHIWPAEKKWLSDQFCYDGTRLAILEMIRSGTTFCNEHFFFPASTYHAVKEMNIRACIGLWFGNTDEYFIKAENFLDKYQPDNQITFSAAPHSPYVCSDEIFLKIKKITDKYNLPVHIHLHEPIEEMNSPIRPIRRLEKAGLLSPKTQAVHMVHCNDEDIELLKKTHTHVIHCPESNLKLASGFCPVKKLIDAGINVALGTDGAASNNDLDMFGEMKTAAMLAKAVSNDPTAVNAFQAIQMATLNGAKALGLENKIGSLKAGKYADFIAIDLSYPNTQPVYNPISQIVYALNSQQVSDVWIAGKRVLKNKEFADFDQAEIVAKAQEWALKIKRSG